MANDYTNTSEHYLPVPAITDKFSYTREIQDLRTLVNKAMAGLAARDSNADNYLLTAGNAGTLLSSSDTAPRGRVAPLVAGADATLLFQDNTGAALTDKWVAGYDDSSGGFAIHNAATIPATLNDSLLSLSSTQVMFSLGDAGAAAHTSADDYVFELGGAGGLSIVTASGAAARLWMGDGADTDSVRMTWNPATTRLEFGTNTASAEVVFYSGTNGEVMRMSSAQELSIGTTAYNAMLRVDQSSASGAKPVLYLDQADDDVEIIRLRGSGNATAPLTRTVVAEAAVTTATRAGFVKVYVQDDGNQITDQAYFMPIYTLA